MIVALELLFAHNILFSESAMLQTRYAVFINTVSILHASGGVAKNDDWIFFRDERN